VARFLVGIAGQGAMVPDLRIEVLEDNGGPAVVVRSGAEPFLTMSLGVAAGRVEQVLVVRNPDELRGLAGSQGAAT